MQLRMQVNGRAVSAEVPPMKRLLDVLREDVGVTGTKEGCGEGECGACSVLVDGVLVNACLVPAIQAQGVKVVTIEGLAPSEAALDPMQEMFIKHVGTQCGICTPGMILAARALLAHNPSPTREQIREGIAGNLCRCTGYQKIVDAIEEAAHKLAREEAPHA